ncbi:hypothetical protein [Geomicrobium sp. JCM 19055]|uniref:hypothetical protein n=1 Tax=Geomicrobium sp. JCM 19055 TaxID=1460649 RepID=UPI00045ED67D|nr:hypothetical protein [Geomicrobium sp. JCM 19055]GAK00124.1 hypothetical protein JCM19055_3196 [Geomicrobium sp. JCM 19055]
MDDEYSYEELKRKAFKRNFINVPLSIIIGVSVAQFLIDFQLPTFWELLPYVVGAYTGVTLGWVVRTEDRNVELERKYLDKRARKTSKRKIIDFILIWSAVVVVIRLIVYILG